MNAAELGEAATADVAPPASSPGVRDRMRATPRRDTAPELALRSELHRRGMRFRVDHPPLPDLRRRRADVVFTRVRLAVFVDGCFWHRCPLHGTQPAANADWWRQKLDATVSRDRDTDIRLGAAGWLVVRVWEHESPEAAADRIEAVLCERRQPSEGSPSRRSWAQR